MKNQPEEGFITTDDRIKFLERALVEEQQKYQEALKIIPQLKKSLDKANHFIYTMKQALLSADQSYQHAVGLFDTLTNSPSIPPEAQTIAYLYKAGRSLTQIAEIMMNDKSKKHKIYRILTKAKEDYPELFKKPKDTQNTL